MESRKRFWTLAAWALLILSPFLQMGIISLFIGKNAFAAYPVWSDEMDYWRNLFSWIHVGLPKGYSGIGEYPAPVGTLSVHGLTPLLLYGGFAKVFGLNFHSIVIYNALWVSLGALALCLLVKPKAGQALFMAGLLMAYVPAVLYCVTSMTEMANYGLLMFYVAFLLRSHRTGGKVSFALAWVTVVFVCLYRISYFVLFLPLVWLGGGNRFSKKTVLYSLLALVLSAVLYLLGAALTAPYPAGFLYNWLRAEDAATFFQMFFSHAKANLYDYFIRPTDSPMQDAMHWLYTAAMALSLGGTFLRLEKKERRWRVGFGLDKLHLGCFLMLFLPFAVVVMIYETNDWSDFRTLAPFLWGAAAVMALGRRKALPALALAGSMAMAAWLAVLPVQGAYGDEYRFTKQPYTERAQAACEAIVYDPQAESPWGNTIRADLCTLQTISEIDAHMGLFYGWFTPETTGKSRWILTDHLKIVVEGYERVDDGPEAKVYRHVQSDEN
ncbi:MAG: hypothetical protein VB099_11315 [Candidatus Limiplasma sp.]|nr:hypothetical protein [Candidatus Limiplasma sp.]